MRYDTESGVIQPRTRQLGAVLRAVEVTPADFRLSECSPYGHLLQLVVDGLPVGQRWLLEPRASDDEVRETALLARLMHAARQAPRVPGEAA